MPRGARPGERRGGRVKGIPNRKTIERLEKERIANDLLEAAKAETKLEHARGRSTKLAKDVIEDFMNLFAGIATTCQPYPPSQPQNPNFNEERFEKYARMTVDAARELAKYQSPQFRAIVVAPAPSKTDTTAKRFTLSIFDGSGRPAIAGGAVSAELETKH